MNTTCRTCGGVGKERHSQGFFTLERTCPSCHGDVETARRHAETARRQLLSSNRDLIEKFLEIAERKVSIIDDYGDENWDALLPEIETCLGKIAKRNAINLQDGPPDEYRWLKEKLEATFHEYHIKQKATPSSSFKVDGLSGVEFEMWVAKFLTEKGFDVRGTPATGDQGADLIAKKDVRTVVVQAKRYQGPVGNGAVQEVISALAYYGADEGRVVTNASFTPSAKALAQKANIKLIDGQMLKNRTLG
jgi:Restriction endonuclease